MLKLKSRKTGFVLFSVLVLLWASAFYSCAKARNIERLSQTLLPELPDFDFELDSESLLDRKDSSGVPNQAGGSTKDEYPLAGNLGGTDRFIVFSPFKRLIPADFTIGELLDTQSRPEFLTIQNELTGSLGNNELPVSVMSSYAIEDAYILFAYWLPDTGKIENIRISEPAYMQDGGVSMRIIASSPDAILEGFMVLYRDSGSTWLIEYLNIEQKPLKNDVNAKYDPLESMFF